LQIFADATNGTIFYDLDAKTRTVVNDFSGEAMSLQAIRAHPRAPGRRQAGGGARVASSDSATCG